MSKETSPLIKKKYKKHRCTSHCAEDGHYSEADSLLFTDRNSNGTYGGTNALQNSSGSDRHCHDHTIAQERLDKKARRKLLLASGLCLLFMVAEIVGGFLANSLAIATDAAHLLTDFSSFMISLFAIHLAARAPTKSMSFGWYRAEVMGALVSVLMIWVVTGILVYMAVLRVVTGDYEINATVMLITAGVGVAFNIVMGVTLHDTHGHSHGGGGHSHGGHGHSHASPAKPINRASPISNDDVQVKIEDKPHDHDQVNINVRAAFIHVVGDFIQSLGVLIAAFIIYYKPEWKLADPICTFLFSVLVLFTTITILKDALRVLMEGTPKGLNFNEVKEELMQINGVKEIHNLRLWSLTMSKTAVSVHLALESDTNSQDILAVAGKLMRDTFGVYEVTIQIENYCEEMDNCEDCQDPKD